MRGPTVDHPTGEPGQVVRLYAFPELMSLLVAAELRKSGIPLAHIRQVVAHLNARGYASPLTQLVFATVGKEIFFQHEDGTWESRVRPDQVVIHQVLKLDKIRSRIRQASARDEAAVGHVEQRRGPLAGCHAPCARTRRLVRAQRRDERQQR